MKPLTLTVSGDPRPQPRPSVGKRGVYYRDPTGAYRAWVAALRKEFAGRREIQPPYRVTLLFVFRRPPSHLLKSGEVRPAKRDDVPGWDLDNLAKVVLDEMERAGILTNDRLVTSLTASKSWGAEPRVWAWVETAEVRLGE